MRWYLYLTRNIVAILFPVDSFMIYPYTEAKKAYKMRSYPRLLLPADISLFFISVSSSLIFNLNVIYSMGDLAGTVMNHVSHNAI